MFSVRAQPLFSLALSSSPKRINHLRRSLSTMSSQTQLIEHIVLFKVKDSTDTTKTNSMINGLNALISLDKVLHLSAAPLIRSASFTHILHSRYGTKEDLNAYAAHPDHVRVVKESVLPICEDVMAVDWIAHQVPGTLAPPPGSVAKVTFLKLKENVSEEARSEIVDVIKGLSEKFPGIGQITVGENFSPGRAKGYSIASIAYFKDLAEMEGVDAKTELVKLEKDKVRDFVENTIVVEFVVPSCFNSGL